VAETERKIVIPIHKPDLKEKLFFFASGLLVSIPFTVVFSQISDVLLLAFPAFFAQIGSVAISTPFIEEFAKVFPLFYRHGENERSIVTLGILAGLGFGLTAFVLNVAASGASYIVMLPWIFFNASSAGITAYGIAKRNIIPFFLTAVALHAANDFSTLFGNLLWYIAGPVVLAVTILLAWHLYRRTSETRIA
jgi:RsiW-degrading membrane proteinase PrsW (M82 family)